MTDPGRKKSPSREESDPKRSKPGIGRGRSRNEDYRGNTIPKAVSQVFVTDDSFGTPLHLLTNYVQWDPPKDQLVQCYRVDFDPPIESVRVKREVVANRRELFQGAYIFNGGNELKTLSPLNSEVISVSVDHPRAGGISITYQFHSEIPWGHPEMFHLYNILMRRNLQHLGMLQMGQYHFDIRNSIKNPQFNLQLWPGIITAINEHDSGILMALDATHKVVRTDTVRDMLLGMFQRDENQGKSEWKARVRRELPGNIVYTTYNNRTYRIDDINFDTSPKKCTFTYRGNEISVIDYMQQVHDVAIADPNQPLLVVRPNARQRRGGQEDNIYLVPERCLLTGMTSEMLLNRDLKQEVAATTRLNPPERIKYLEKFLTDFHRKDLIRTEMSGWGIQVGKNLLKTIGRTLPAEKILLNENTVVQYKQFTGKFDRELHGKRLRTIGMIKYPWAIVHDSGFKNLADFKTIFVNVNTELGNDAKQPTIIRTENSTAGGFVRALRGLPDETFFVLVFVPNNNKDRYDAIKKELCCEQNARLSQVVTNRIFSKAPAVLRTIMTKICIQISVKTKAVPWGLTMPNFTLMLIGFDVHHSASRRGKSVGAFVCSLTSDYNRWFSRTSFHENNEEMSNNFATNCTQNE
ncbi:piwi-like protein 1 [Brevipalpus obovatus]|uniref:piwi-like protein 1 n=1 Tax=Brevipalpus obovatus TaxID=246614 RepID=UPI003D9E052C